MLYNKNQFRKTNDKKVLHKIGKHWVTVSVAFLSLLGLGAVSTTATTHADTTDNANAQTTSAAPNSNSADSIQKQVTKQANALHNQLLGHAAVSQKPAQQGTARLGSVNGRVNQAQAQNTQQNNKSANNQMSANHSNVMRLGAQQPNYKSSGNLYYVYTDNGKQVSSFAYHAISDSDLATFLSNLISSDISSSKSIGPNIKLNYHINRNYKNKISDIFNNAGGNDPQFTASDFNIPLDFNGGPVKAQNVVNIKNGNKTLKTLKPFIGTKDTTDNHIISGVNDYINKKLSDYNIVHGFNLNNIKYDNSVINVPVQQVYGHVTIRHVDINGRKIKRNSYLRGKIGAKVSYRPEEIKDYKFSKANINNISFTSNTQTVKLIYKLQQENVINYVDNGKVVASGIKTFGSNSSDDPSINNFIKDLNNNKLDGLPSDYKPSNDAIKAAKEYLQNRNRNNKYPYGSINLNIQVSPFHTSNYIHFIYNNNTIANAGWTEPGMSNKSDADLLNHASAFSDLPSEYYVSDATHKKYTDSFAAFNSTNYGTIQYNIPVKLKYGYIVAQLVTSTKPNDTKQIKGTTTINGKTYWIINYAGLRNINDNSEVSFKYGENLNKVNQAFNTYLNPTKDANGKTNLQKVLPSDYKLDNDSNFITPGFDTQNNQNATVFKKNDATNYVNVLVDYRGEPKTDYIHYVDPSGKVVASVPLSHDTGLSSNTGYSADFDTNAANFNGDLDKYNKFDNLPGNYSVINPESYKTYMNSRDNTYGNTHMDIKVQEKTQGTDYIKYTDANTGNVINVLNPTTWNTSDKDSNSVISQFKNQLLNSDTFLGLPQGYHVVHPLKSDNKTPNDNYYHDYFNNDNDKYGSTALDIKIAKDFAPINITYIDANSGQQLSTVRDTPIDPSDPTSFGGPSSSLESNGYSWSDIDDAKSSNLGINKFTYHPQSMTVAYDHFENYDHPNHGKGDLDVFYFHNGSLQQYSDYGSFPDGTLLKPNAFTQQGFNIVQGKDINKFNNGTQTIILTSNGDKTLQLPQTSDIIAPNAQDVITYKTVDGKTVGQWKSKMGYSNQSDEYFYNNYIPSDHPDLPEQYKLANNSSDKFNQFMHNKPNSDYGTNSYIFTVEPNQHSLTVKYVNAQNANQKIAPSDVLGDEIAGNPVNLPKPKNANGFDLNSGHVIQVNGQNATKFTTMPDNDNTVVTLGYNPVNITDNYQNKISINSDNNNIKTISDKGSNNNWNFFKDGLKASQAENAPFIFTNNGTEYMIPNYQNSDMESDVNTISDVINDMDKQENTAINPFKTDKSHPTVATQTKTENIHVQPLNTINVQFVDTSNNQHKVIEPNSNVANSDASLKVNNNTITDTGYKYTTQDISSDTYTLPSMVSKYLPKGYELAKADNIYQIPSTLRDNIINNNDQNFIEFNGDDANSAINFSSKPQNIQIAIKPIPKPQYRKITVKFLDGDKDNTEIPGTQPITTKGQVGSQFDLIAYEDTMLPESNGHVNYTFDDAINESNSKNADLYEYASSDQTIDLIYSEIKGRIYINYIDRTMGNTVHTTTDTGLVGSPFNNDKSYLENIPSNYYFDGVSDNGVTNYSSVDQNINVYMKPVKPATADRTTITVNYVDKQSNKVVANAGTTSDSAGAPFDITPYVKNVPSDYHAVGFNNYTQNYGDSNTTVDVLVAKNAPKPASSASSSASGSAGSGASGTSSTNSNSSSSTSSASDNQPQINGDIYLNYRDVDSGQILSSQHFTEPVGTTFALDSYVRNVPKGYKLESLDHVKGATNEFYYGPQTIDIYVTKLSNIPQQHQGIINVSYVDAQTGKSLVPNNVNNVIKGDTNSPFNYNNYMKSFNNYTFDPNASTNLNVNKFNNGTQYITLAYDRSNCSITVNFVDNNGNVIKSVPTSAKANTPFNASDYKNDVPAGYEIKGSNSIVNMYDQQPQTFIYKVAQPSYHTITVNYVDGKTGKTILTKSDTEDADTPFDIDNYISYIPRGYNWTKMPSDAVSKFDNSNHTYSIILNKIAPAKPSSASAKPSSSASAKPSSASSASSSSAPSSTSTTPSSSSAAPSSSASVPFIPIMPSSLPSSVSSVASSVASPSVQSVSSSAAPVDMTNKNYPITYAKNTNKPDMVTVMGRKYAVHYHANGKNTARVRVRIMKHNKVSYHYKNVVVSTNLPIAKVSSDNLVRAVDHVDFNKVNKHVLSARGLNKALSNAKPGEVISYHGTRLAVVNDPIHWRYFMVRKNALAHILLADVGRKDTRNVLRARHEYTIFIKNIIAVHGKRANYVRYEFSYHHHNFWVTGRDDYTPNSYWQKSDFRARHARYVRVVRPCRLYKSTKYNRLTFIRNVRRGVVARVAKVVYINRPSYEQTRLVLTNGHYITANKNFVHIIK